MSKELPRTYKSFTEWPEKSKQTEYTEETPLLAEDGTLLAKGWARHNVFTYNRDHSKPNWRKKEWDFFVIRNENFVVDLSFANISIGGYVSAKLTDLKNQCVIADANYMYVGGANKYILPPKGDVPNTFKATVREAQVVFDTHETYRTPREGSDRIHGWGDGMSDFLKGAIYGVAVQSSLLIICILTGVME